MLSCYEITIYSGREWSERVHERKPKHEYDQHGELQSQRNTCYSTSRLCPGKFDRYEQWLRVIGVKAVEYPGNMGLHVIYPSADGNDCTMMVRFVPWLM